MEHRSLHRARASRGAAPDWPSADPPAAGHEEVLQAQRSEEAPAAGLKMEGHREEGLRAGHRGEDLLTAGHHGEDLLRAGHRVLQGNVERRRERGVS